MKEQDKFHLQVEAEASLRVSAPCPQQRTSATAFGVGFELDARAPKAPKPVAMKAEDVTAPLEAAIRIDTNPARLIFNMDEMDRRQWYNAQPQTVLTPSDWVSKATPMPVPRGENWVTLAVRLLLMAVTLITRRKTVT
jgi:hypothetical protein